VKLVRLGALFGSIVLLVATSITMINKRTHLHSDLDSQAVAADYVATGSVRSTLERAVAVVDVASESSDVSGVSDNTKDELVASFEGAEACVTDAAGDSCTGPSLLGSPAFERGSQLSKDKDGEPAVVADEASDGVFVVADSVATVALWLPLDALISSRFQGAVYPVNPNARVVGSIRAYPSVSALPEQVDLAVIAVPRDVVLSAVDDCATRGVRALVVITAGFSEASDADGAGKRLQQALLDKVRGYGMRMVGPNCMGLLNADPAVQLNASFSPLFPPPGRLAMSSQSGALGLAILALAVERHLGLSTFVSVGNKADVSSNDLLQYWEVDDNTDVILLYLESFGNPRRFAIIARRVSRSDRIAGPDPGCRARRHGAVAGARSRSAHVPGSRAGRRDDADGPGRSGADSPAGGNGG